MTTDNANSELVSRYLDYLPAIYQQDAKPGQPSFLGPFLLAFEQVLTGRGDPAAPGIEEILDGISDAQGKVARAGIQRYFDPGPKLPDAERAPAEFLPWLAGWVALTLRGDMDEERRRDFIARAVSLYRLRGTRAGLEQFVGVYTQQKVTIAELTSSFQIGVHSRIGVNTILDGGAPHFFRVLIELPLPTPEKPGQNQTTVVAVKAIIDQEKPAHTSYKLDLQLPRLQIGVSSKVGVNTILGTPIAGYYQRKLD